ncbi:CinA family protein [Corynebacterium kozikiae]|uniref:CinA family protein n=1 Tax=Corynebacterium kozikiae TaxID=2968469 RepID=UPI00211D095E|nr:CinA family protein [Corynebacterium sp. 76QC2CO]MCQ9342430.1 CinA family protein [Corynebacterium sp. 76QC2CO]
MTLVQDLAARGETIATCESLTAGLCAARIADTPGASEVLRGGLITYATEVKVSLAGVDQEIIDAHGVVSAQTARAMAAAAARALGASWGVSLTGYAGPEGDLVGQVFVGVVGPEGDSWCREFRFAGGRQEIRGQAAEAALLWVGELIAASGR